MLETQNGKRNLGPGLEYSPLSVTQPGPHPCGLALGRDEDACKGVREATVICCQHTPGLVQVSPQLEVAKVWDEEKEGAMLVEGTTGVSQS